MDEDVYNIPLWPEERPTGLYEAEGAKHWTEFVTEEA